MTEASRFNSLQKERLRTIVAAAPLVLLAPLISGLAYRQGFKHRCQSCHRLASPHWVKMPKKGRIWGRYRRLFCNHCRRAKTKIRPGPQQRERWAFEFTHLKPHFLEGVLRPRKRRRLWR
jgi:hypothetical protein